MCFDAGPPRVSPRGSGWRYDYQCQREHNFDAVSIILPFFVTVASKHASADGHAVEK
jgi:hypothetical protein